MDGRELVFRETQVVQRENLGRFGQNPHHHVFAVIGRRDRNPDIDFPAAFHFGLETAVLGRMVNIGFEAGEDFDAAHDLVLQFFGEEKSVVQNAVDPQTGHHLVVGRFQMDVRSPGNVGEFHNQINELDNGNLISRPGQLLVKGGFKRFDIAHVLIIYYIVRFD